jgi:Transposase IS66 family.
MEAAHMTFEEEALKSRIELRRLRQETARVTRSNEILRKKKVVLLEKENLTLRAENKLLKKNQSILNETILKQSKQIESLQLIVEELRRMVFGKKKKDDSGKDQTASAAADAGAQLATKKRKPANRSNDSYRRAIPTDEDITDTINHPLTHCPDCGELLSKFKQVIRYKEDLANLTALAKLLKRIEKHIIGTGFCSKCKKRKTAHPISPQVSVLGENIKQFVSYLSIVMRLSFEQIKCFLADTAGFHLSGGEIAAILTEQAIKLKPERDRISQKIRGAPGSHYDETGWNTRGGLGNYAWIKRPTEGTEALFLMGRSRGKGNAEELQGETDNQVGISDDYGAYTNMFKKHQLCMAHPNRKLRDLTESKTLSATSKIACEQTYGLFKILYADLEKTLATEYIKEAWLQKRDEYIKRIKEVAIITANDPQKLKEIKEGLRRNAEKYFTCLTKPGIPADNNKAERGLRHIVLKRKISYGSKSQTGADTMGILCTALLSAWWGKPKNFFEAYKQMLTPVIAT